MERLELTHCSVVRSSSVLNPEGGRRHAARAVPLTHRGSAAAQCPGLVAAQPVGSVGVFQLVAACRRSGWTAIAKRPVVRSCRHLKTDMRCLILHEHYKGRGHSGGAASVKIKVGPNLALYSNPDVACSLSGLIDAGDESDVSLAASDARCWNASELIKL